MFAFEQVCVDDSDLIQAGKIRNKKATLSLPLKILYVHHHGVACVAL